MSWTHGNRGLHDRLERAGTVSTIAFAAVTSFTVYFCMYGFRKPLAVATYAGHDFAGTGVQLKTALVLSQLVGYVASKYIGIKFCSQLKREQLFVATVALIGLAELSLLGFALLPTDWKVVAIFFNGLPLGMVWGLAMRYLEGRRATELLVATLSCSYIFATGVVKDAGKWLLQTCEIDPFWMPFWVGLIFLPPLVISAWLLDALPRPDEKDRIERSERTAMTAGDQWTFLAHFSIGLILLSFIYVMLTAFRDFRDNYAIEILKELNLAEVPGIFTQIEVVSAIVITVTLGGLSLFRHNRHALVATFGIMICGTLLIGSSTMLWHAGVINGLSWMILVGLGAYLAYVPYTVLFDRIFAATRATGTSVFAIYLIDSLGYTGSFGVQLYKDLWKGDISRLVFFSGFALTLSVVGLVSLLFSGWYFIREERLARLRLQQESDASRSVDYAVDASPADDVIAANGLGNCSPADTT
ncbi:DUF5690 family protein [Bremerella cremea]|uniref:DUF5690 family protein n=1 Tax=Bremerella cremea TaxID=1031537 RepID=UPI0031E53551